MVKFNEKIPAKEVVKTYDPVVKEVNGRKVQLFIERTKDLNEGLKYTDFSLQSLMDADAIDLLQPLSPLSRNTLDALDIAGVALGHISADLDAVSDNSNVEPKKDNE